MRDSHVYDEKEGHLPDKQTAGGLFWISGMTRSGIARAVRVVAGEPIIRVRGTGRNTKGLEYGAV